MSLKTNRRTFIATASAVSLWTRRTFAALSPFSASPASADDVYAQLGVAPVINAQGTMTMLGGSLIPEPVHVAMAAASRHFVHLPDLHTAAGNRIAQMLKLPEGHTALVTSGAAGAITLGTAAVLTQGKDECIRRLPDLTGMKTEVIIQKSHRYPFDQQIRATGVKLVEVETRDDLRRAVNDNTAMLFFTNYLNHAGRIKVDEFAQLARELKLPSFNDAAADTPPVSHLWDYNRMGYDLVAFSGGKAIRGPQCAGLLLGRKDLIGCALINGCPFEDTLCRSMKVGKEEIVGMVKALELYLNTDHDALTHEWWRRLDYVAQRLRHAPAVSTAFFVPDIANHVPHMQINWDPRRIEMTPADASNRMKAGKPSILMGTSELGLTMCSFMLQPGEERIIADRLLQVLRA